MKTKSILLILFCMMVLIAGCGGGKSGAGGGSQTTNDGAGQPSTESSGQLSSENSGKANEQGGQQDEIELEFWTLSLKNAFEPYFNALIAKYEEAHPHISIKWVDLPGDQIENRFLLSLTSGDVPDIANVLGISKFASDGVLTNIDEMIDPEIKAQYLESIWEGENTIDNVSYSIPWYGSGSVLFYNKKIFADAGLDPNEPPRTFEELVEYSHIIKEKTGVNGFEPPIMMPGDQWFDLIVTLNVPSPFNEDMTAANLNNDVIRGAMEMWTELYKSGAVPPEAINQLGTESVQRYTEGRTAMLMSGGWIERFFTDPEVKEHTAIAPPPLGHNGTSPFAYQYLAIPAQSEHKEEALDFAIYLTNKENILEFSSQVDILPALKEALEDPFFQQEPQSMGQEANLATVEPLLKGEGFVYRHLIDDYQKYQEVFKKELELVMYSRQTVDEAIAKIEAQWNEMLQQ